MTLSASVLSLLPLPFLSLPNPLPYMPREDAVLPLQGAALCVCIPEAKGNDAYWKNQRGSVKHVVRCTMFQ